MDQLIVTKWKDRSLTALLSDGHCRSLTLESGDESLLGNIYIGKVKNVVKNINAAFIDLGGGKTGYFSLAENPVPLYTDELNQLCSFGYSGNSEKKVSPRKLKAGDELLILMCQKFLPHLLFPGIILDFCRKSDLRFSHRQNHIGSRKIQTAGHGRILGFQGVAGHLDEKLVSSF